jgi:Uma2 family endonuclease
MRFITETTFRVAVDSFLESDFVFYPAADTVINLKPGNALLVVEISDTSLGYDLGRKASFYAELGIRELWVINAITLDAHVHKNPRPAGYQSVAVISGSDTLSADFAPETAVALNNLRLA